MSLTACPSCGLPRVAEDIASSECPVCGLSNLPPVDPEPVPEPVIATPPSRRMWPALLVGLVSLAALVIVVVLLNRVVQDQLGEAVAEAPIPISTSTPISVPAPLPQTAIAVIVPEMAPSPRFIPELAPIPRAFVAVLEMVARPRVVVVPLDGAKLIAIDRPNGDYELPVLRNREKVQLVGRVGRLVVRGVEDGAALDALDLAAREVVFVGKIDGGSTARVRATAGPIKFQAKVDGASEVVADAPAGMVLFMNESSSRAYGPVIDGGAQVTVAAQRVVIGTVMGVDTRIDVTLHPTSSAPSFLRVGLVDGPATVRYRNVAGSKGKPNVLPGELRGGAVLKYDK